ncbi:MAG: sugar MFS transporter [Actinomycetota bacterium]
MRDPAKLRSRHTEGFVRHRSTWATYGLLGYFAYLETVLGPLMPFLRSERGYSYTIASLHFSAFAFGGVLVGVFGDRVVARRGRWVALWGGGAGMALGVLLVALIPMAAGTITGALVMGSCGSLLLITTQAVLADRHGEWAAVAITESNVAASACAILASLAVGIFAAVGLGWRLSLVLPVVALALLGARFGRESLTLTSRFVSPDDGTSGALPVTFWIYWSVLFLGVSVEWCMAYWGADFLDAALGLNRSDAASALSLFFVGMLVGRIQGSRLARALKTDTLLLVTLCVALAAFPVFWLSHAPLLALMGLFVVGLGVGSVYPLTISVGVAAAPRTNTATARLALAGGGAILVAPFVLGAYADRLGIQSAFGLVVPLLLGAIALSLFASRLGESESPAR